jgi:HK97 gp10 family phage protein
MAAQVRILNVNELQQNLRAIIKQVNGGASAQALADGAEVVVEEAKRNVTRQGLVDTGTLRDSIQTRKVNQFAVDIRVDVPYAAAHEYGLPRGGRGVWAATERQVRFFWAMYSQTGDEMWKALALKRGYTIPMRPYLRPAIDAQKKKAMQEVGKALGSYMAKAIGASK